MIVADPREYALIVSSTAPTCPEQVQELKAEINRFITFAEELKVVGAVLKCSLHYQEGQPYLRLWGEVKVAYLEFKKTYKE